METCKPKELHNKTFHCLFNYNFPPPTLYHNLRMEKSRVQTSQTESFEIEQSNKCAQNFLSFFCMAILTVGGLSNYFFHKESIFPSFQTQNGKRDICFVCCNLHSGKHTNNRIICTIPKYIWRSLCF